MRSDPFVEVGADHESETCAFDGVAASDWGGFGAAKTVTVVVAVDVPFALFALKV